jgi:hypothetical protein
VGVILSVSKIKLPAPGLSVILSEIQVKGGDHAEEVLSAVPDGKDGACVAAGEGRDPVTEREFAQLPQIGKPAPPSKIVQVIEEMLHLGVKPNLHIVGYQPYR